jgi:MSHA pilin protein MshC
MCTEPAGPSPSLRRPPSEGGFTIIELTIVLILVAILSAVALPKFDLILGLRNDTWRDSLVAGLRFAAKSAVAHRRLVCADVSNTQLTLTVASANPATACDTALTGPTGNSVFATSGNSSATTTVSAAGTIYFQPDGRATSDGAGLTSSSRTITPSGASAIVTLIGETGHVE